MRRFDEDGVRSGPERRLPEAHPLLVRALRILLMGIVMAVPVVPAAFFLMPLPRGADGITLCMPGLGPLQQFAEGLDPDLEEVVHIHERVHATQCRRLGSIAYARTYLDDAGMLDLEAEAYCAEARTLALRGHDTRAWVSRIVETLYSEYPHGGTVTYEDVTRIVGHWCPPPDLQPRRAARP